MKRVMEAPSAAELKNHPVVQAEFDLAPNQAVVTKQRLKGSCPWLFADDGSGLRVLAPVVVAAFHLVHVVLPMLF